ncbi:capsular polysaccharide synthesis enzyme Cap5F [Melissococcus plutonius DAT561]|uniref:Capsular polysaccharide synthesis enzyme Cap5F n=1 Tax=Melissococcus plutonius TaxID=33970 RepID=A0A2Z5Y3M3_9ENTE|nr:NAD-dependent epimerase/dehydratase family protein [Melissococcus plutonius]BAL62592.1 capsular polysaccharide synthesis enzyme Cap5F [Melissococcus plutonius DAT561]BBC61477.1 capsular polysaccharide synthesis enzyme Cap5F [Melissococcus plutonius]
MINILVTGAAGFVGKNLVAELKNSNKYTILTYDVETPIELLDNYCQKADFVFHLAGVNRPKNEEEFMAGNFGFTSELLNKLDYYENRCPVMLASSIQANQENPYGRSKRAGEELLQHYHKKTGAPIYIYRFANLYGKWSQPNYNTVVATFCYKIARDEAIEITNPDTTLQLCYIDDVIAELIRCLNDHPTQKNGFCEVPEIDSLTLEQLSEQLKKFKKSRETLEIPQLDNRLEKNLYSTYLSFLPTNAFAYDLTMNKDERGSFTEFLKTPDRGQVSINISKPGITKGNHWHHTKNEKFLVVSGEGVIRFRKIDTAEVIEYFVSGEKLSVVDIPVGYVHAIENLGQQDLVTVMWANERFDQDQPDTYFLEV